MSSVIHQCWPPRGVANFTSSCNHCVPQLLVWRRLRNYLCVMLLNPLFEFLRHRHAHVLVFTYRKRRASIVSFISVPYTVCLLGVSGDPVSACVCAALRGSHVSPICMAVVTLSMGQFTISSARSLAQVIVCVLGHSNQRYTH